jgi:glycine cleavage system H protein
MSTLRFTKEHEWIRVDRDEATVGITTFAQDQLGDIVRVELPGLGAHLEKGKQAAVVESVKAASELDAPVSGEVTAVNSALADDPAQVNQDAEGKGWFFKLKLSAPSELDALMDEAAYKAFIAEQR